MHREPPVPWELWEQVPPHVRAVLLVVIDSYERRINALEAEVRELKEQPGRTSQNSSQPPSSDGPHIKRKPPREPSGRKRGGQPGQPVHQRTLRPLEQVDEVVVGKPTHCRRCGEVLPGTDAEPLRPQGLEVPPSAPQVTEYQLPRLAWVHCRVTTCGTLPLGVPVLSYGPRLASLVGLCSGAYRMSKRMVASFCTDGLGVPLAVGELCLVEQTVARALEAPVQEGHR